MWGIIALVHIMASAAFAAAPEAKPSALSAERCRALLPSNRRASEGYREYYDKFLDMICSGEAAQDERWQSCIISRMRGGTAPDRISEAYNWCIPGRRACVADMSARPHAGIPGYEGFAAQFCEKAWIATPTERACVLKFLRKENSFVTDDSTLYGLCIDEAQECVRDLLATPSRQSRPFLDGVSKVCARPVTDIPADYRACMREDFDAGKRLNNPSLAWRICAPAVRAQRACVRDQLESKDFKPVLDGSGPEAKVGAGVYLCGISDAAQRACALGELSRPHPLEIARIVCALKEPDARACMDDFFDGNGVFKGLQTSVSEHALGDVVCATTSHDDQACIVGDYLRRLNNGEIPDLARNSAVFHCQHRSKDAQSCKTDFKIRYGKDADALVLEADAKQVCEIMNSDVRDCVLKAIEATGLADLDMMTATCQARYANQLFTPRAPGCPK